MKNLSSKPLCIVPARANSKRLPRKNVALLGGKPLLVWTIEAALNSDIFDNVWVSSEDEEVLKTAEKCGGTPMLRRSDLANDSVTVLELCLNIVRNFIKNGRDYSSLYVLLPTSPFRKSETIRRAWQAFIESGADSLLSVVPLEHPPQWAMIQQDGWLRSLNQKEYELSRQILTPCYRHDGGHAIADISKLLESGVFLGARTLAFPVPVMEAIDINEELDLNWAEFLLQKGIIIK